MRIATNKGNCVQCGASTNIQLDCGKFACIDCLNRIGKETKNVREYIEDTSFSRYWYSTPEKCDGLIDFLNMCKDNNIMSVKNIINTLNAIKIQFEYKMSIPDKKAEKIEK
ncbi:MAG: hypothetical protein MST00_06850 [Tenericutes bacterium]|nr:hypothetical protein [Mycoplasmatota bacterium]